MDDDRFAGIASTAFQTAQTALDDTTEDDFEFWDFARKVSVGPNFVKNGEFQDLLTFLLCSLWLKW